MKIKVEQGQNIFFTSDTHYNHKNICEGTTTWDKERAVTFRKFQDLKQMNQAIVDNINQKVEEDDILVHLGDWSFGGIESIWEFRKQIKCKNIHLILGNHDHHIEKESKVLPNCHYAAKGVTSEITDGPNPNIFQDNRDRLFDVHSRELFKSVHTLTNCTVQLETPSNQKDIKIRLVLCHFPIASWDSLGDGVIHLHGHTHLPSDLRISEGRAMDVGVDGNELKPLSLREILTLLKGRPKKVLSLKKDHHQE